MKRVPILLLAILFLSAASPVAPANPGDHFFQKIKALAGQWQGVVQWTGARTDSGEMQASYFVTSHGNSVVENLGDEKDPSMTTVYHRDGAHLRMTHFCGVGNQPRLKASEFDEKKNIIRFSFVDATNMASPDAPHVDGFEMRFRDKDHITLIFTFKGAGKASYETITLQRVSSWEGAEKGTSSSF